MIDVKYDQIVPITSTSITDDSDSKGASAPNTAHSTSFPPEYSEQSQPAQSPESPQPLPETESSASLILPPEYTSSSEPPTVLPAEVRPLPSTMPSTPNSPSGPRPNPGDRPSQIPVNMPPSAGPSSASVNTPSTSVNVSPPPTPPVPVAAGMTLAQKLYASAYLPRPSMNSNQRPSNILTSSPPPGPHSDSHAVSSAAVSAEAYHASSGPNSVPGGGSFYPTGILQNIQQRPPNGGRTSMYHTGSLNSNPHASSTISLVSSQPSRPTQQAQTHVVRPQSQLYAPNAMGSMGISRPNSIISPKPTTVPSITLVARPPGQPGLFNLIRSISILINTFSVYIVASNVTTSAGVSLPQPPTTMNTAMQGQIGVSGIQSVMTNPSSNLASSQANSNSVNHENPLPAIPSSSSPLQGGQQQQNASYLSSSTPPTYSMSPTSTNVHSVQTSLPQRPPLTTTYTLPYVPNSSSSSPPVATGQSLPPHRPTQHPAHSLPLLPSQYSSQQYPQSRPTLFSPVSGNNVLSNFGSTATSATSTANNMLSNFGRVAGRVAGPIGKVAGRAALRYAGKLAIGSVLGTNPSLLSNVSNGGILDGDTLNTLSTSLANLNVNATGVDMSTFQAAFQGVPGTDYQGIINSIGQQQQTNAQAGVNYHAIIQALVKIQHASAQAQHHSQIPVMHPASGLNANANANHYQTMLNAQAQQIQQMQSMMNSMKLQQMQQQQQAPNVQPVHNAQPNPPQQPQQPYQGPPQPIYTSSPVSSHFTGAPQVPPVYSPVSQPQQQQHSGVHPQNPAGSGSSAITSMVSTVGNMLHSQSQSDVHPNANQQHHQVSAHLNSNSGGQSMIGTVGHEVMNLWNDHEHQQQQQQSQQSQQSQSPDSYGGDSGFGGGQNYDGNQYNGNQSSSFGFDPSQSGPTDPNAFNFTQVDPSSVGMYTSDVQSQSFNNSNYTLDTGSSQDGLGGGGGGIFSFDSSTFVDPNSGDVFQNTDTTFVDSSGFIDSVDTTSFSDGAGDMFSSTTAFVA